MEACPKCNGLRQHPMACVIGLSDDECPAKPVDVIGAGGMVGYAGKVRHPARDIPRTDFMLKDLSRRPGKLFAVQIKAPRLERYFHVMLTDVFYVHQLRHIPSYVVAGLYKNAVEAEMSDSVRAAVSVSAGSVGHESATKFREDYPGKKALVEVRAAGGSGAVTNLGMSYIFELRDAVVAVIESFEPPDGAWVADEKPHIKATGDFMPDQSMADAQSTPSVSSVPQLDPEIHAPALATAAASAHYSAIEDIERNTANYLAEAKQFIAMFNAALTVFQAVLPPPPSGPVVQQQAGPPVARAPE